MKNQFFLDITSFISFNGMTGIQRVVSELTYRFVKNFSNVKVLYFSNVTNNFYVLDRKKLLNHFFNNTRLLLKGKKKIKLCNANNCFLIDIDSVYDSSCYPREFLYKKLKKHNFCIISLFHDLLPINNFYFFENYEKNFLFYFLSSYKYSDYILFTTNAIKDEYKNLTDTSNNKKLKVIKLGSNLNNDSNLKISSIIKTISKKSYCLMVATFEPRKNHISLIKAYLKIYKKIKQNLILVGRLGWMYEPIFELLKKTKLLNKRIFVVNNATNDEVSYLYKNAHLFLFPSFAEGYGLPIIESLYYKCPVLCSDIPVFREISKNKAIFFNPNNYLNIAKLLQEYCTDNNKYLNLKKTLSDFKVDTWDDSFNSILEIINEIQFNH